MEKIEEKRYLKWYNKVGYGSGDVAGNLLGRDRPGQRRKGFRRIVARLLFEHRVIDRILVEPRRRASL